MALFDENVMVTPAPRRRRSRTTRAGVWALVVALVLLGVMTFLPTAYVIQQPGPVYNTLGTATSADGDEVPLIRIEGAETFATDGALDLLTVQVVGNRDRTPSWFELAVAWFQQRRAVLPIDAVFPAGETTDERNERSTADMVDSQKEATAAALSELGYDVSPQVEVYAVLEDSAAEGVLQEGDVIVSVDGQSTQDAAEMRRIVNEGGGAPVEIVMLRDGQQQTVQVTPRESEVNGEAVLLVGVTLMRDYDFPFDVAIQLNNVGGPSAGMMFALGIIDTLTPGELNGGRVVAGTGTITADGDVGAIGGIRQKMWGAVDAGAEYFLAPESNCAEVAGHIPDGLRVFAVATLGDALAVLDGVREDGDLDALPACR